MIDTITLDTNEQARAMAFDGNRFRDPDGGTPVAYPTHD